MKCTRHGCDCPIPDTRRSDAKYCSEQCYREAKKVRDSASYYARSLLYQNIKHNDNILSILFQFQHEILRQDLENVYFNFDNYVSIDFIGREKLFLMYRYAYSIRHSANEVWIKIWEIG